MVDQVFIDKAERERAEVIALAERVGYGFMIDVAAREWDALLERKHGIKGHSAEWLAIFARNLKKEGAELRRQGERNG